MSFLTSVKTGISLCINDEVAVDVKVYAGTITSCPGSTPTATTAACKADVAELKTLIDGTYDSDGKRTAGITLWPQEVE